MMRGIRLQRRRYHFNYLHLPCLYLLIMLILCGHAVRSINNTTKAIVWSIMLKNISANRKNTQMRSQQRWDLLYSISLYYIWISERRSSRKTDLISKHRRHETQTLEDGMETTKKLQLSGFHYSRHSDGKNTIAKNYTVKYETSVNDIEPHKGRQDAEKGMEMEVNQR